VERKIRGDLEGTLADWEQSIAADPANSSRTRLYRALILTQNGKPDAELAQEVDGWKDGSLKAIGQFVVGRTDETALLAAVGKATDQPALGAQGEVYYCIGVMRLVHGNAAGAQEFFQKSVATGLRSSFARQFARAELTRLGHATAFSPPAP
jgi:lipoprotein NlpI